MNKQRVFAFALVIILASAALVLAYQQPPQGVPDLFAPRPSPRMEQDVPKAPTDAQTMQKRIVQLEEKVAQLDKQIQAMQKQMRSPRIELLHERDE